MDEILLYLSIRYNGNWMSIYDSLQKKEELKVYDIKKAINDFDNENGDYEPITLINKDYPAFLKSWYKPPFIVFKKNNKLYYLYGDKLSKSFEIKQDQEKKYQDFLRKQ